MRKLSQTITQINLLLLFAQILIIAIVWRFLPPEIPLFYSHPWGKDQLARSPVIVILPLICLIVLVANVTITRAAAKEEILIKRILASASLTFTLLILIGLIQIIRLII